MKRPFYYGWIIVGVALVSMAFWIGIRSSFSVFYVYLLEEFRWGRGETAGAQSLALIVYTILAPFAGGLIDRFGPRRVIVPGVFLLGTGLVLSAGVRDLTQLYLIYGLLVGGGITAISITAYSAILAHWFERKRGVASGLASSGMGIGTFLFVPLSQYLISVGGWRWAFVILGLLSVSVLIPLNAFFLRHKPQDLGLYPDGAKGAAGIEDPGTREVQAGRPDVDWTLIRALRVGRFWALMAFAFLAIVAIFIVLVHNVRFMVDQGLDKKTATFAFAMVGIISSAFRIFWGWLSDRTSREVAYSLGALCIFLGACSLLSLEFFGQRAFVYPFVVLFGMGWGATAPLFMAVAADLFQGRQFGAIYGLLEAIIGMGGALGAWIGGVIFDTTQSYAGAFLLAASVSLLSILFVWLAAPRKYATLRAKAAS